MHLRMQFILIGFQDTVTPGEGTFVPCPVCMLAYLHKT